MKGMHNNFVHCTRRNAKWGAVKIVAVLVAVAAMATPAGATGIESLSRNSLGTWVLQDSNINMGGVSAGQTYNELLHRLGSSDEYFALNAAGGVETIFKNGLGTWIRQDSTVTMGGVSAGITFHEIIVRDAVVDEYFLANVSGGIDVIWKGGSTWNYASSATQLGGVTAGQTYNEFLSRVGATDEYFAANAAGGVETIFKNGLGAWIRQDSSVNMGGVSAGVTFNDLVTRDGVVDEYFLANAAGGIDVIWKSGTGWNYQDSSLQLGGVTAGRVYTEILTRDGAVDEYFLLNEMGGIDILFKNGLGAWILQDSTASTGGVTAGRFYNDLIFRPGSSDEYFAAHTIAPVIVPEPASLALLGLGGLVMLRRQRQVRGVTHC
jgi:hypothetical protein